ncbi:hypothetical protein A9Q96_06275 [Rhodobacterales bacterium 52_120_T64]|nr:hypothetical protein A9Q96_06275 [Rhodobacterales bacterium 52_120_T64]
MTDALVDTNWVAKHVNDSNVRLIEIDWDGLEDYNTGHIPGAIGWNWKSALWDQTDRQFPTDDDFCARMSNAGVSNNTTVVFYGAPVQFGTYAWWVLKLFGHTDVRILDGGQVKWEKEGRPIAKDIPEIVLEKYTIKNKRMEIRAGRDHVLAEMNNSNCSILDHRSGEEYSGSRVGLPGKLDVGAERYGRIPGATHVPFDSLLNDDTTFKTIDQLTYIIGSLVPDKSGQIISYCRLAHRATLASFVMTELLGYKNVRVYDGSWTEWGSIVGVPIER